MPGVWTPPHGQEYDQTELILAMTFRNVEKVGPTARDILIEAREHQYVMLKPDPARNDNARYCSIKRLVKRGLLEKYKFGPGRGSTVYKPTPRALAAWLHVDPSRNR